MAERGARLEELPAEARCYFDGVAKSDADAAAGCFADNAVVIDVDRPIVGRDTIRSWLDDEVIGGSYRILEVTPCPGGVRVLLTFAPSGEAPFRARYVIELAGGEITRMVLEYA